MKKITSVLAAAFCICSLYGCSGVSVTPYSENQNDIYSDDNSSSADDNEAADYGVNSQNNDVQKATEGKIQVFTSASPEKNNNGGSSEENNSSYEEDSDSDVINQANYLFNTACETEWRFTVGSPYSIDSEQYIENSYGWQYFLVTDDNIHSVADVRNDYHSVFSVYHEDDLDTLFIEDSGNVYCLAGARGSDIFYEGTVISSVKSRSDNEICFDAESSYSDDGFRGAYKDTKEFSIILEDGVWKVNKFSLPY